MKTNEPSTNPWRLNNLLYPNMISYRFLNPLFPTNKRHFNPMVDFPIYLVGLIA